MGQLWGRRSRSRSHEGDSPLLAAVRRGAREEVAGLLAGGQGEAGGAGVEEHPLCLASRLGHTSCVRLLLQVPLPPRLEDKGGFSPLVLAVYGGHMVTVKELLTR